MNKSIYSTFVDLTLARIGLLSKGWFPWQVVVEILAVFAVKAFGVVGALASSVNHVILGVKSFQRETARSVPVARA